MEEVCGSAGDSKSECRSESRNVREEALNGSRDSETQDGMPPHVMQQIRVGDACYIHSSTAGVTRARAVTTTATRPRCRSQRLLNSSAIPSRGLHLSGNWLDAGST